jgi:hypothetical protein
MKEIKKIELDTITGGRNYFDILVTDFAKKLYVKELTEYVTEKTKNTPREIRILVSSAFLVSVVYISDQFKNTKS